MTPAALLLRSTRLVTTRLYKDCYRSHNGSGQCFKNRTESIMNIVQGLNDSRQVTTRRMSNLERGLTVTAQNIRNAVVSTSLAFTTHRSIDFFTVINKIVMDGHAAVFKLLVSVDPKGINFPIGHGMLSLYEAVRQKQTNVVAVLLERKANPMHPVERSKTQGSYNSSLISLATMAEGQRLTEMLLTHSTTVAQTVEFHTAALRGQLDAMRLLMQDGADVNEILFNWRNGKPMHFAASKDQVDAMKLLNHRGACSDLKNMDGKAPAHLLKKCNTA